MSAWAKPGVKCVCIAPSPVPSEVIRTLELCDVSVGQVLTIRDIHIDLYSGEPCLLFEEVFNGINAAGREFGFFISRFRPITSRTQEQDLEHFLPLLSTVEEPA